MRSKAKGGSGFNRNRTVKNEENITPKRWKRKYSIIKESDWIRVSRERSEELLRNGIQTTEETEL